MLPVTDIDADLVTRFLSHVENERNNGIRTRNIRRSAVRGFFRHAAIREPALPLHGQQVRAIPAKRREKRLPDFPDGEESAALLAMPDLSTWIGQRDRTLLPVALQAGLRVSEPIGLNGFFFRRGTHGHDCCDAGRTVQRTPVAAYIGTVEIR